MAEVHRAVTHPKWNEPRPLCGQRFVVVVTTRARDVTCQRCNSMSDRGAIEAAERRVTRLSNTCTQLGSDKWRCRCSHAAGSHTQRSLETQECRYCDCPKWDCADGCESQS